MIIACSNKLWVSRDVMRGSRTAEVIITAVLSISPDTVVVNDWTAIIIINAITICVCYAIFDDDIIVDIRRRREKAADTIFAIS